MDLSLSTDLRQIQTISPMMLQQIEILQMNARELDEYIIEQSLENPLIDVEAKNTEESEVDEERKQEVLKKLEWLESIDVNNKIYYQQDKGDEEESYGNVARDDSDNLLEYLLSQLHSSDYSSKEWEVLIFIISSLDGSGYYSEDSSFVATRFGIEEDRVEELIADIRALEPRGIAAKDLTDCLLIQLRDFEGDEELYEIEKRIIEDYLEDIAKHHITVIARKLSSNVDVVKRACENIKRLNPKPANGFGRRENMQYISPDVLVVKMKGELDIIVSDQNVTSFKINGYYKGLLESKESLDSESLDYIDSKLKQAEWLRNCINHRAATLEEVAKVLVEHQVDFFVKGTSYKRPMRLSDISERLSVHESTVSRAMKGKFLQCSFGIFPLNYFLSGAVAISGTTEQSADNIKDRIREIVNTENKKKPYSDQKISEILSSEGIDISRRTVNKYRTQMGILDKSGRKI